MPGNIPPPRGELYRVYLPGGLIKKPVRPNRVGLGVLKRHRVEGAFRLGSFSTSLSIYYRAMIELGQVNIAKTLLGIILQLSTYGDDDTRDDYVRQQLKAIHSYCYSRIHENKGYILLMHLHILGGPSPYTKDQIEEDVTAWVTGTIDNLPREFCVEKLNQFMARWPTVSGLLSFEEYSTDFLRWSTSGGGPKSERNGEVYRTKWAYCLNKTVVNNTYSPCNLYVDSLQYRQHATIALKEEPSKTREIISTPMSSYIRQCYLLYCRGRPPVQSPISSPVWLSQFFDKQYAWYGSVDGDRFDHHVPKWIVIEFIRMLGSHNDECRMVAEMEIAHLETLDVELYGKLIKYEHGLLSGWRITSVLGTFISWLAGEWINARCNTAFFHGELGDDLILFSNHGGLTLEKMCEEYEAFGIPTNSSKSISSHIGEFLRKILSSDGILGYPALGLKSCIYRSPWLEAVNIEPEQETSVNWLTFLSRLLPHRVWNSNIVPYVLSGLYNQLSMPLETFIRWIATPVAVGGGGTIEFSIPSQWLSLQRNHPQVKDPTERLLYAFGVMSPETKAQKQAVLEKKTFTPIDLSVALKWKNQLRHFTSGDVFDTQLPRNVNLTNTLLSWYFSDAGISGLCNSIRRYVPRLLRIGDKLNVLLYFMGMVDKSATLSTLTHSGEQVSAVTRRYSYVTNAILYRRRNIVSNLYLAAGSLLYLTDVLHRESAVYCTW